MILWSMLRHNVGSYILFFLFVSIGPASSPPPVFIERPTPAPNPLTASFVTNSILYTRSSCHPLPTSSLINWLIDWLIVDVLMFQRVWVLIILFLFLIKNKYNVSSIRWARRCQCRPPWRSCTWCWQPAWWSATTSHTMRTCWILMMGGQYMQHDAIQYKPIQYSTAQHHKVHYETSMMIHNNLNKASKLLL